MSSNLAFSDKFYINLYFILNKKKKNLFMLTFLFKHLGSKNINWHEFTFLTLCEMVNEFY